MNLRDLQYLSAIAEYGHMGRAALACHVSQPTMSMQLKKLEGELGVPLLERVKRTIRLTPEGKAIAKRAELITREAEGLKALAKSLRNPLAGECRVGAFPTLAPYYLPTILPHITKQLPLLKLLLVEEKTQTLLEMVEKGTLDFALIALPIASAQLSYTSLFAEPFMLAVPAHHRLSKRKFVTLVDIKDEPILLLEEGHCLRAQALEVCSLVGFHESAQGFRATSLETLRHMVSIGAGVTLMPACACTPSDALRYIPFKGDPYMREIALVWRKSSPRTVLVEKLVEVLKG